MTEREAMLEYPFLEKYVAHWEIGVTQVMPIQKHMLFYDPRHDMEKIVLLGEGGEEVAEVGMVPKESHFFWWNPWTWRRFKAVPEDLAKTIDRISCGGKSVHYVLYLHLPRKWLILYLFIDTETAKQSNLYEWRHKVKQRILKREL